MKKMKIEIDKKITDEMFMEHCLNLKASGYNPMILIVIFSLVKSWHISKFMFLMKEMKMLK